MVTMMMASKLTFKSLFIELEDVFGETSDRLSLAMSTYFIIYATVQLILSFIFRKINVKIFLTVSIAFSCIATALMALSTGIVYFCIMMGIMGIFQAGIWAGNLYFLNKHLPAYMLPIANTVCTCGVAVASTVSHGISALAVAINAWWVAFVICAVIFLIVLFLYVITVNRMEKYPKKVAIEIDLERNEKNNKQLKSPNENSCQVNVNSRGRLALYYVIIGAICFIEYFIYCSVLDWIPDMLKDTYSGLSNSLALVFSMVVPIGVLIGPILMIMLCEKYSNYFLIAFVSTAIMLGISIMAVFGYNKGIVVAITIMLLFALMSRAVGTVFSTIIVTRMKDKINTAGFAAFTNSLGSIGAALAPVLIGNLKVSFGWTKTYIVIALTCLILLIFIGLSLTFSKGARNLKKLKQEKSV